MKNEILNLITDFYINSSDFNGITLARISQRTDSKIENVIGIIEFLVKENKITLAFASHSENPEIKRFPDLSITEQVSKLKKEHPHSTCAYPAEEVIKNKIDLSAFDNKPFTKMLYCSKPQLYPIFFDLEVLESYFRDPRYDFSFHDFSGDIHVKSEHYDSTDFPQKHKVFIQTFGIGYDINKNRVVVVYLRYLKNLSPEHQQIWNARKIDEDCKINSDYSNAMLYGIWPEYYSVYHAFCIEQIEINKISTSLNKPNLFLNTFEEEKPEGFFPMLRPTEKNYHDFIHILDKLLSENISRDFFKNDIPLEEKIIHKDGTIEIQRLGTLTLLRNWLSLKYKNSSGNDVSREVIEPFKIIRDIRQTPAHKLNFDKYDKKYPRDQDKILGDAKMSLTKLRYILMSHPKARTKYKPPDWLDSNKIVFY